MPVGLWMTKAEAARYLDVTTKTIGNRIEAGTLEGRRRDDGAGKWEVFIPAEESEEAGE